MNDDCVMVVLEFLPLEDALRTAEVLDMTLRYLAARSSIRFSSFGEWEACSTYIPDVFHFKNLVFDFEPTLVQSDHIRNMWDGKKDWCGDKISFLFVWYKSGIFLASLFAFRFQSLDVRMCTHSRWTAGSASLNCLFNLITPKNVKDVKVHFLNGRFGPTSLSTPCDWSVLHHVTIVDTCQMDPSCIDLLRTQNPDLSVSFVF